MQPAFEITFHPISAELGRHGLNPHGDPLWRVVWADSRKTKVIHRGKITMLPRYHHGDEVEAKGHYVLERWAPPEMIAGMTREEFDGFLATMTDPAVEEYPDKGDWELSRIFNEDSGPFAKHIDEVALHRQLAFHGYRHANTTSAERAQASADTEEKKEQILDQQFDAKYDQAREENLCTLK